MMNSAIREAETLTDEIKDKPTMWMIEEFDKNTIIIKSSHAENINPENWRELLASTLILDPNNAAVGLKRLDNAGKIYSMGEFVIHPKGFHYLGKGLPLQAYRFPEEVDIISGGAIAVSKQWLKKAKLYETISGELGALELTLGLRKAGGRCLTIPQVVATDDHHLMPESSEQREFEQNWGFNWQAADLNVVRSKFANTGILWNARLHADVMPFSKYEERPAFHWKSYCEVESYQQRANSIVEHISQFSQNATVLDIGCGDGLFSHLVSLCGSTVTGIDLSINAIEQAKAMTTEMNYPNSAPEFIHGDGNQLPFDDHSFDMIIMLDIIEHLSNPVHVLKDAARVIKPGGFLAITTPMWNYAGWADPVFHITEYSIEELVNQIELTTGMTVINKGLVSTKCRDIIAISKK